MGSREPSRRVVEARLPNTTFPWRSFLATVCVDQMNYLNSQTVANLIN